MFSGQKHLKASVIICSALARETVPRSANLSKDFNGAESPGVSLFEQACR